MREFKNGDFIRLKDVNKYDINRKSGGKINIFEISNITPSHVEISNCKEIILRSEIEAIPINGKDDFQIWYYTITASDMRNFNESAPKREENRPYYLEAFKSHFMENDSRSIYEKVIERGLKYVHEVQDFLSAITDSSELKINAI